MIMSKGLKSFLESIDCAKFRSAWDVQDWTDYFDERAAICEYDGGLARIKAEDVAYLSCVEEWRRQKSLS